MKAILLLLLIISASYAQQERDEGVPDLASRVPDAVLENIKTTLLSAREAGAQMGGEPQDLMPAQEALQWISQRPYIIENSERWPSPETTESRVWADCKGKSLWLADRLLRLGYQDVQIIIGRIPKQRMGHAWVELAYKGQSYILDGTYRGRFSIIPKDRASSHTDHQILHIVTSDNYVTK